jgi:metal-responsive CopG/Arc/MetJ family transcriptional regulator
VMQTIQIVVEESLLRAADREAKRLKTNRSKLFRDALREHLKKKATLDREAADRAGYRAQPVDNEVVAWESVAAWPED